MACPLSGWSSLRSRALSSLDIPMAQRTDRHIEGSWETEVDRGKTAVIFWGHREHV